MRLTHCRRREGLDRRDIGPKALDEVECTPDAFPVFGQEIIVGIGEIECNDQCLHVGRRPLVVEPFDVRGEVSLCGVGSRVQPYQHFEESCLRFRKAGAQAQQATGAQQAIHARHRGTGVKRQGAEIHGLRICG